MRSAKIVVALRSIGQQCDVKISMSRHKGPGRPPIEGVLVKRKVNRSIDIGQTEVCVELLERIGESTQIGVVQTASRRRLE